jgi:tetratricopeptide (TPR) repeat protein
MITTETMSKRSPADRGERQAAGAEVAARVAEREQANAPALYWLAVIHNRRGEHDRAVELLNRALALRPSVAGVHVALAEAYRNLGELSRAAGCCRTALMLNPNLPEALCTLGVVLQASGEAAEAADHFRRALQLRPDLPPAHRDLGMALRELGQHDDAIEHLRRAIELAPDYAAAHTCLGLALGDAGRHDEAVEHCRRAARLQPDVAIFHHNLGNALRRWERWEEARAAYLEALRLNPKLSRSHLQIGMCLKAEGALGEALPWYKEAVELQPDDPVSWEQLADLHSERHEHTEAIACWRRAIELAPTERAHAHLGLGWSLQETGRLTEASDEYQAAARVQPDCAQAHVNLGVIREELGEMAEAEAAYRTAIALQPKAALAHAKLGTLLRDKLADGDLALLEERLADPAVPPSARTRLFFALGVVLDARGEYTRAARCSRQANAENMETARGRHEYSPAQHARFVDSLKGGFTDRFFERTAGEALETRRPVFIFGLPRSGTTLVEQVLSSHSRIHGAGELRLARQSFEAIPAAVECAGPPLECLDRLDQRALRGLALQHMSQLDALAGGRKVERIIDKMPDNYLYLGLLAAMFPQAVFIHCRRDLRDVAVSCWVTDFRFDNIPWASDPECMGSRFREYLRVMAHWRAILPVPIHEVNYEDTVADLERVAQKLLAACGLEWEPACLEFHQTPRRVRTASISQVRKPIYQRSVGRWKSYETELADLFRALPMDWPQSA